MKNTHDKNANVLLTLFPAGIFNMGFTSVRPVRSKSPDNFTDQAAYLE